MARQTSKHTVKRAKSLRRQLSLPEVLLWKELRQSSLKFRKQHPIGSYVVDFYCAAAKLAVEVDGIVHDMADRPESDIARDDEIRSRGIEVLRLAATDVLRSSTQAADVVVDVCKTRIA